MGRGVPGKKYFLTLFIIAILLLGAVGIGFISFGMKKCSDGTGYDHCSANPPYSCYEGKLVEYASICGCPFDWDVEGRVCKSDYMGEKKQVSFDYLFDGERKNMDFVLYEGIYNYLGELDRTISVKPGQKVSRRDFKLRTIDEMTQKNFLIPLVVKIQNSYEEPVDQLQAATSIVQNIPYGFADEKAIEFYGDIVNYSRYPYEVLYDNEGVCSERVDLLVFMLREMGYGIVVFYFPAEDHEAVGVRCPKSHSFDNTGYCYLETTKPFDFATVWDSSSRTFGLSNDYQIVLISEGKTLRTIN
jgi:hypothetical protein